MNVNHLDLKKTALLFFDILNGYVAAAEPSKPRVLKPWIQNAVKLSKAGRAAGCHRESAVRDEYPLQETAR